MGTITVLDSAGVSRTIAKVDSTGQALEADSLPVVLPAAQVAAMTPPAAIAGFATEATLEAARVLLEAIAGASPGGDASAANQATQIAAEQAILAKISDDPATQTTLAAMSAKLPAALGAVATSASLSVAPATDAAFPVVGYATNPSGNFTRPGDTTTYAVGDLVANSTTAGSVVAVSLTAARAAAGSFMLRRLKLHKSGAVLTNASFRVHIFSAAPTTVTNGDNGAFSVSGVASYLGAFDVIMNQAFTDGAAGFGVPVFGPDQTTKLASGTTIFSLVEARAAYVPANAEVFTITLDALQN